MCGDSFDLDRLRMTEEDAKAFEAAERQVKKSGKAAAAPIGRGPFIRYPVEVIYSIGAAKNAGTAKLFPLLLHLDWKADQRPFKLTNVALKPLRINRCRKGPVLRELEQMGLIRVVYRGRKSPLISVLVRAQRREAR